MSTIFSFLFALLIFSTGVMAESKSSSGRREADAKSESTSGKKKATQSVSPSTGKSSKSSTSSTSKKEESSEAKAALAKGGESKDAGKASAKKEPGSEAPSTPTSSKSPPKETAKKAGDDSTTPSKTSTDGKKPPKPETEGTPPSEIKPESPKSAAVSTINLEEIEGYESYSPKMQEIVQKSVALTKQNLRYQFGSSDPSAGGMDCSGTMYRVLRDTGFDGVPRQSDEICRWVMRNSVLYRTEYTASLKEPAYEALQPGDLLFWTGTYDTGTSREIPISHVMLYLGKRKKDGKAIVFGASDGRSYEGQRRNGVSVFDFALPKPGGKSAFYGYGPIPGMPPMMKSQGAADPSPVTSVSGMMKSENK